MRYNGSINDWFTFDLAYIRKHEPQIDFYDKRGGRVMKSVLIKDMTTTQINDLMKSNGFKRKS